MNLKKIIILFLLLFLHSITYSQSKQFNSSHANLSGNPVLYSAYDYSFNNSSLRTIDLVNINWYGPWEPVMVGKQMLSEGGERNIVFSYGAFGVTNSFQLLSYSLLHDSPSLQYCSEGPLENLVLVLAIKQDTLRWVKIELDQFSETYFDTPLDALSPSFVYLNDGTIWLSSADMKIYKSTDVAVSFQYITSVGGGDSNFITPIKTPAELPIHSSSNGQFLSIVGAFEGAYLSGNPDIVYWYYSTDFGATWQGEVIGKGSVNNPEYGQVINRNYAPYFTDFAQGNAVIDDIGVTHVVYNGYGEGMLPGGIDTSKVYPVLYWNSNHREWKAITHPEKEAPDDGHGNLIIDYYPGNAIGNAYPTVSVSSDGHRVLVFWTGPEYNGNNQPFHLYPGDGSGYSTQLYYTDVYTAFSYVGGEDIVGGNHAFDTKYNVAEMYPLATDRIIIDTPNWREWGIYIFFNDSIPGVSIFNQNSFSVGNWCYGEEAFYFPSVENENNINGFILYQNFPNPFNPTTIISFEIPKSSFVKLKIYNTVGEEIATLVEEEKLSGNYEVEFDSSNLPSGIYFYSMNAGAFSQTKKMILLK